LHSGRNIIRYLAILLLLLRSFSIIKFSEACDAEKMMDSDGQPPRSDDGYTAITFTSSKTFYQDNPSEIWYWVANTFAYTFDFVTDLSLRVAAFIADRENLPIKEIYHPFYRYTMDRHNTNHFTLPGYRNIPYRKRFIQRNPLTKFVQQTFSKAPKNVCP
jgi:hypothetical protein